MSRTARAGTVSRLVLAARENDAYRCRASRRTAPPVWSIITCARNPPRERDRRFRRSTVLCRGRAGAGCWSIGFLREPCNGLAKQCRLARVTFARQTLEGSLQFRRQVDGRLLHAIDVPYLLGIVPSSAMASSRDYRPTFVMAILIPGMPCSVCGKSMNGDEEMVLFSPFVANRKDPLFVYLRSLRSTSPGTE